METLLLRMTGHTDPVTMLDDAVAWCEETFGENGTGRWFRPERSVILVLTDADATLFKLRWM